MASFVLLAAAILQAAHPSQSSAPKIPITVHADHPVGVEASSLARSIEGGGLVVPRTYKGELAVMGEIVSVRHSKTEDIVVLNTDNSPDRLTAYISPDPHLKVGKPIGIVCKKADGTETKAEVSQCRLVSAPDMPAATMTFSPIR